MSETEGFFTDIRTAELFFRFCRRYSIETPRNRIAAMRLLVSKKKARYLRDINPILKGKRVLKIQ